MTGTANFDDRTHHVLYGTIHAVIIYFNSGCTLFNALSYRYYADFFNQNMQLRLILAMFNKRSGFSTILGPKTSIRTENGPIGQTSSRSALVSKPRKKYKFLYRKLFYLGYWILFSTSGYHTACMVSIIYQ